MAAAERSRKRLRDEGTCSVCLDYFADPVSLDCGHNFCRACIAQSWGESRAEAACPQCRESVQAKRLRPNRLLANMVEAIKELSDPPRQEAAGRETCEKHQEPLKLFCQDDRAPICVVCDRSKEHRAHHVVPMDEAAQEYKNQLCGSLEILKKERGNILQYKTDNEKKNEDLLKQMEAEKEKTSTAFRQRHQFLEEQEKLVLARMDEVEKEIAKRRDKHQATLSGELSSLDSLIQEMEEKQQQSVSEFLQNIGDALERCKREPFKNPVAFPAAVEWKIHDFFDLNPFLEAIMTKFKDTLVRGLQLQQANVTLDPDTAHPKLILSKDGKRVRGGDNNQRLLKKPERFDKMPFVLGREGFTSGRHFWDVAVGSKDRWAVGVARKSVRRKGKLDVSPEEGIWALARAGEKYWALEPLGDVQLSPREEVRRIRVTLNCPAGQVAFFDADSGAPLYRYSVDSCGESLLPFFYVTRKAHLGLSPPQSVDEGRDRLPVLMSFLKYVPPFFQFKP